METPTPARKSEETWAKKVDRLSVSGASGEGLNMNVEGRQLTSPLNGFGQLWQKTYRVALSEVQASPQEVVQVWKEKLPELMPADSRFYPSISGVKPGEIVLINASLPGIPGGMQVATGVLILYADDVSFSVMTPAGHPEAGFNTFSAADEDGVTICQIQSLARANDPIYELGFRLMGGSKQQEAIWRHVLTKLSAQFGVQDPQISLDKVCMDTRLQWAEARNVWHNAVIRTTLGWPARKLSGLFKRRPN
jgi:hypothetical protein